MPPKNFYFVLFSLLLKGASCFFVRSLVYYTGGCIRDIGQVQSNGSWGSLYFVGISYDDNSCLHPGAQFRFLDNGAMLSLKRQGCLAAFNRNGSGYNLDMFYVYVGSKAACAENPDKGIYRALNQSKEGGLLVYYKENRARSFEIWCALAGFNRQLEKIYEIDRIVTLAQYCHPKHEDDHRFNFGSVTCFGNMTRNANCPKNQYMVVRLASFRGLLGAKTCGVSDQYSCDIDVTCIVKKQCDGLHECNITVDDNLFSPDLCPGLSNYLYFEYQCADTVEPYKEPCVHSVFLSNSSLPYEGVVQITTGNGTKNVCWQSLKNNAKRRICAYLGYKYAHFLVNKRPASKNDKVATFSGSIDCDDDFQHRYVSQCSISPSTSKTCSEISYLHCINVDLYQFYPRILRPLLQDKRRFPDSSFSASASTEGHDPSDARVTSGRSWCAPISHEENYLQVDLGRVYKLRSLTIYGDSNSAKWVASYNVNYTVNMVNWTTRRRVYEGSKNAYVAANAYFPVQTRVLRIIPVTYVGQPCMRVELSSLLPDVPTNLAVTNLTPRSAKISWKRDPNEFSTFWVRLKKNNSLILETTTTRRIYEIKNLTPYTRYEISVAAENWYGFGQDTFTLFLTPEDVPSGPPLHIDITSRSVSSLGFTWDPPEKSKQNGVIVSYSMCISQSENGQCFQTFTTSERKLLVRKLSPSTEYFIRVLASTKVGLGNYSESKGVFTNGKAVMKAVTATSTTLTFSLAFPKIPFVYFYVVALKLRNGEQPMSSDSYKINDLGTYAEATESTNPKPYIANVLISSDTVRGHTFVLGDGRNTSDPKSGYFNGPLEHGANYSIFQRIITNCKGDHYYSTDWNPASKTSEHTERKDSKGLEENDDGSQMKQNDHGSRSQKYLAGIIVLAILLMISLSIHAYVFYKNRQLKQSSENVENMTYNSLTAIGDYKQVDNELPMNAALKMDENDDQLDGHSNEVPKEHANQKETGI